MLDIKFIRENLDTVKQEVKNRGLKVDVDELLELDKKRRELLVETEKLRAEQNKVSDEIANQESRIKKQEAIEKTKKVSEQLKKLEPELREVDGKFDDLMYQIPNVSHKSVPIGKDESGNKVEKKWGKVPEFNFKPKDHIDLGMNLDLIDAKRGVKVSGSRFYFLKNEAVLLEFALIKWLFDLLMQKGFTPILVPDLVKEKALFGTGWLPAEKNEIYKVNPGEDNLFLSGTAEVPIAAYHSDETFDYNDLPKSYVGFSSCFRREAGSYGKDTRGIFRVHQFDKIEMFKFVRPENSWKEYDKLIEIAEEILQNLELPYQKTLICTGDTGLPCAKRIDLEAWIPSQRRYREVISGSNTTDFQARRLNVKFKDKDGKRKLVHTLNCTACAVGRTLIAILENYQQKDGSVEVPEVLRKYAGFERIEGK